MAIVAAMTPTIRTASRKFSWRTDVTADEIRNATAIRIIDYTGNETVM